MKKLLLLPFAISLCMSVHAQNKAAQPNPRLEKYLQKIKNLKAAPIKLEAIDQSNIPYNKSGVSNLAAIPQHGKVAAPTLTTIGKTFYDLQTNAAISNRLVRNADGTLSAAWTTASTADFSQAYPNRGSGYNYFDGSNWVAPVPSIGGTIRAESYRMGFTNIAVTASGKELLIGHSSAIVEVNVCSRSTKGTGTWVDYDSLLGVNDSCTWAKVVAGGVAGENVYVIVQGSGVGVAGSPPPAVSGQAGPLFYSRSVDGGATFSPVKSIIAGTDSTFYRGFNGDDYSIDARGDVVAIVVGSPQTDLILLKSTDGGVTFVKTPVEANPIPQPYDSYATPFPDLNGDTFSDTLELPTGDAHVMIDNNNICHVFYTKGIYVNDDGMGIGYYANVNDDLWYWNETTATPAIIAHSPDVDGDGVITTVTNNIVKSDFSNGAAMYRGSLLEKPSSGVDAAGNLYASYMGACEDCDSSIYQVTHKHTFIVKSIDNGATWSQPYDVLREALVGSGGGWEYAEATFGCIARDVDSYIHIIYQQDEGPGMALSTNDTVKQWNQTASDIVYAKILTTDIVNGISNPGNKNNFSVSAYPNPASDYTTVNMTLSKTSDVTLQVTNTLGQVLINNTTKNMTAGSRKIKLNTSELPSGIYIYTVVAGNEKVSNKLIVY